MRHLLLCTKGTHRSRHSRRLMKLVWLLRLAFSPRSCFPLRFHWVALLVLIIHWWQSKWFFKLLTRFAIRTFGKKLWRTLDLFVVFGTKARNLIKSTSHVPIRDKCYPPPQLSSPRVHQWCQYWGHHPQSVHFYCWCSCPSWIGLAGFQVMQVDLFLHSGDRKRFLDFCLNCAMFELYGDDGDHFVLAAHELFRLRKPETNLDHIQFTTGAP